MSFPRKMFYRLSSTTKNKIKISSSLPNTLSKHSLSATEDAAYSLGRAALCTLKRPKGSLTVETACVLPLFMFLCMCIVFFIEIFSLYAQIQGALFQAARGMANELLIARAVTGAKNVDSGLITESISVLSARSRVLNYAKEEIKASHCLLDGENGLNFWNSKIGENDMIDLIVSYRVKLPYSFGINVSFPIVQRCRMRAWTGESGNLENRSESKEVVYITDSGTVYHKSMDCSHIKLKIQTVASRDISELRNNGGGKYYACEKCTQNGLSGDQAYITSEGNKYHNSLSCSGLKRSVKTVFVDQIEGYTPCTRCCK